MSIPCEDCVCIAACRHKSYSSFLMQCSLIGKHLYMGGAENHVTIGVRTDNFDKDIFEVNRIVKPTTWKPAYYDSHRVEIRNKGNQSL